MDADGLDLDYVLVTGSAVDRIESALVPARIGTDVTIEAFRRSMNRLRILRRVHFVAVVTGIHWLGIRRLQCKRHEGEEENEA